MDLAYNIDSPSGRIYRTPDGDFPSITTVLSKTSPKNRILKIWREALGEEKADKITKDAAERGGAFHTYAETKVRTNDNELAEKSISSILPKDDLSLSRLKPWIEENVGKPLCIEEALWSVAFGIAGRVDLIAEYKKTGKPAIIDWKTAREGRHENEIEDYFLQAAGYAAMYAERTGIAINRLVIVICSPFALQVFEKKTGDYLPSLVERIAIYKNGEIGNDID